MQQGQLGVRRFSGTSGPEVRRCGTGITLIIISPGTALAARHPSPGFLAPLPLSRASQDIWSGIALDLIPKRHREKAENFHKGTQTVRSGEEVIGHSLVTASRHEQIVESIRAKHLRPCFRQEIYLRTLTSLPLFPLCFCH